VRVHSRSVVVDALGRDRVPIRSVAVTERDLWCVVIGDPPYIFGPFGNEASAVEYADNYGGTAWPLWRPENAEAHAQSNLTFGHFRSH
jgi:hypothetical protein